MFVPKPSSCPIFMLGLGVFFTVLGELTYAAITPIGNVDCSVNVHFSDDFINTFETCSEKIRKERKEKNGDDKEEEYKPYPRNVTLEDFDFDDQCHMLCVLQTTGIVTDDEKFPDKKGTTNLFTKGKISDDKLAKITSVWDSCLERTEQIAKSKEMNNCKRATLLEYCFFDQLRKVENSLTVDC